MNINTITTKAKSIITLSPLRGYRTYITAGLMIILAGLNAQGYIDNATFKTIESILGGLGLIALRAGVK